MFYFKECTLRTILTIFSIFCCKCLIQIPCREEMYRKAHRVSKNIEIYKDRNGDRSNTDYIFISTCKHYYKVMPSPRTNLIFFAEMYSKFRYLFSIILKRTLRYGSLRHYLQRLLILQIRLVVKLQNLLLT